MSSKEENEQWDQSEEEFHEEIPAEMQREVSEDEHYSEDEKERYDEEDEEFDDASKDVDDEEYDEQDDDEYAQKGDADSEQISDYVPEFYVRRQRELARKLEEDQKTKLLQQSLCAIVLLATITWTVWLTFWIPLHISIDTTDFRPDISKLAVTDTKYEFEVHFNGLGELMFTNHNILVGMWLTSFTMDARFSCDPNVAPATSPLCASIANDTSLSPWHQTSSWNRGAIRTDPDGKKHYRLVIPKIVASDPKIRDVMEASCKQNQKFHVQFRAEAGLFHDFSNGFTLQITDIPPQTLECVEPNQPTKNIFSS